MDLGLLWVERMRRGDFAAAWEISDRVLQGRRGRTPSRLPRHEQWLWDGRPLSGRRVLVHCYHGLGDTLQFLRYVPLLDADVTLWAQPVLLPLLPGPVLPLHEGDPGVERDVDVEIMELPHVFRTTLETIPREVPYLYVHPAPLARDERLQVGLVWGAGEWDDRRSISPAELEILAGMEGVRWHALQRGPALRDRPRWARVSGCDDVLQTARVMKALDLVITVDSMPAHLAGALGVPVWTLLPREPDWRWLVDREDSPWYPTMRLFRQERAGEWGPVLRHVAERVRSFQPTAPVI